MIDRDILSEPLIFFFIKAQNAQPQTERKLQCQGILRHELFPEYMRSHHFPEHLFLRDVVEENHSVLLHFVLPGQKIMLHILVQMGTVDMEKIDRIILKEPDSFVKSHPEHVRSFIRNGIPLLQFLIRRIFFEGKIPVRKTLILNFFILPADILPVIIFRKGIPFPGIDCIEGARNPAVFHRLQKGKSRTAIIAPELDDTGRSFISHIIVSKSAVSCPR